VPPDHGNDATHEEHEIDEEQHDLSQSHWENGGIAGRSKLERVTLF
jgi:hypothetical protein